MTVDETKKLVKIFEKITKSYPSNKKENLSIARCFDNYVGQIEIKDDAVVNKTLWFCCNLRNENHYPISENGGLSNVKFSINENDRTTIVIVLESPHKDEYNNSKSAIAPAPALGTTGCSLDREFVCKLNEFMKNNSEAIQDGVYDVILMNAVQFQCSMGIKPLDTNVRNKIFLQMCFNNDIRINFSERLKEYKPKVIINCCTDGNNCGAKIDLFFLQEIDDGIKVADDRSITLNNMRMTRNFANNKKRYKLYEFVQYMIDMIDKNVDTNAPSNLLLLKCGHPSSWSRANAKISKVK